MYIYNLLEINIKYLLINTLYYMFLIFLIFYIYLIIYTDITQLFIQIY
jgi:hypothetical protein